MGWEERHKGRRYLYRNQRVDGKPVKTYLGASGRTGLDAVFVNIIEDTVSRLQKHESRCRALTRKIQKKYRDWIDDLFAAVATANADLRIVVDGILYSIGYHKHHRGEWQMQISNMKLLKRAEEVEEQIKDLKARLAAMPNPMLNFQAPTTDAEAVEVYAKARAGDLASQEQVRTLIVTRGWVESVGDLGRQATTKLIHWAAGKDPVWKAGITEKAEALRKELLGEEPTILDHLLVRRVVNGWIATSALELELTARPRIRGRKNTWTRPSPGLKNG